jgi:hypothetical protein
MMNKGRRRSVLPEAVVALALLAYCTAGCTVAARQVQPAGLDDMEAGWISYPEDGPAASRALALRRVREYCGGPFTVTGERPTWERYGFSLLPTPMIRLDFRCGAA